MDFSVFNLNPETVNVRINCDSLYNQCLQVVGENFVCFNRKDIKRLPGHALFDVYYVLYKKKKMLILSGELSNLEIMARLMKEISKRRDLLKMFQAVMEHKRTIASDLVQSFRDHKRAPVSAASNLARSFTLTNHLQLDENVIMLGLRLGNFLEEAGWYLESEGVLRSCRNICRENNLVNVLSLECHCRVLHVQSCFYLIQQASESYQLCVELAQKLESQGDAINYAALYTVYSTYFYCNSDYDKAYEWSVKALGKIHDHLPPIVIIDTLCQASKTHVLKRQLEKAELLILQAVYRSRELCNHLYHSKFMNSLLDYAFYLLNSDCVTRSVTVYQMAMKMKQVIFGQENLQVAIAEDELAYALYVNEYSTGRFTDSKYHAVRAIRTFKNLLPEDHLLLASAHRVKALILEEIALDSVDGVSVKYYKEAEQLHMQALELSLKYFGENNVQTAKHYGNIGRLYQSMQKYEEAEQMQLKAIEIKEKVLGPDDYEVGLSVGHLASLYNYHMLEYHKAEKLYFRSIEMNLKLFSHAYSGLEYDYRGLIHVYECLENYEKMMEYTQKLEQWRILRSRHERLVLNTGLDLSKAPDPLDVTLSKYAELSRDTK